MPRSKQPHLLHAQSSFTSRLLTIASLGLVIAGTVGLVLLRKPLVEESRDSRSDASVSQGDVTITTSPAYGTTFTVNNPINLDFKVNTHGVQTDGVQLTFYIEGDNLTAPTVEILSAAGLVNSTQQVQSTDHGYKVTILALPALGQPFSTNSDVTFARASFSSSKVGSFSIDFDINNSVVTVFDSDPVRDELRTIQSGTYQVGSAGTSPTPSPTPTPKTTSSPTPTPTPSPTPTPGTGGTSVKQCNESCASNSECSNNQFCYSGKCRLVTNPSSTSCVNPADQGLSFSCNEYCSNTGECGNGYSCLNNRCRRADNPDDTQCRLPSNRTQQRVAASCSRSCQRNADCAANLRCYQGECRLAANPTSSICSATTPSSAKSTLKGGSSADQQGGKGLSDITATNASNSASAAGTIGSNRPDSDSSTNASPSLEPLSESSQDGQGSWLSSLRQRLPLRLLAVIAIALGGLILALLLIPRLLGRRSSAGPTPAPRASDLEYEKQLQAKLNALKQQSTTPSVTQENEAVMSPPPSAFTTTPTPVITSAPTTDVPVSNPPFTPPPTNAPVAMESTPAPTTDTPVFNRTSSMMERIREKGINPPASTSNTDQSSGQS